MSRFKSIAAVTAVFLLGAVVGAVLALAALERVQRRAFVEGGGEAVADLLARRLAYRLRADATQREQIRNIYRETGTELEGIRRQVSPELRAIFERTEKKFRAILRPEQLVEFDKITAQLKATWDKDRPVEPKKE